MNDEQKAQFLGKALLVSRLQQTGTERAVNLDGASDDTMGQLGEFHSGSLADEGAGNQ